MEIQKFTRETAIIEKITTYEVEDSDWYMLMESSENKDSEEVLDLLREKGKATYMEDSVDVVETIMIHETEMLY